jgi:hypothetical protein
MADRPGAPGARALSRMCEAGSVLRLRRGVYVDAAVWRRLTKEERLQLRMLALVETAPSRPVFSHWSAALLHGLPISRRATDRVDLAMDSTRNRAVAGARAHLLPLDGSEVVEVDGMLCTSLLRTTVDVAADSSFEEAVVLADVSLQLLPGDGRSALTEAADLSGRRRGIERARQVIAFADPLSGSPGESISRVRMHRLGFVRPELQVPVVTDGITDYGDFGWEEVLGLGEFDGEVKYRDDRYRLGGEVEDVVIREKNRENRMRRQRPRFARWDWADLQEGRLERILRETGIPKRRKDDDRDAAA